MPDNRKPRRDYSSLQQTPTGEDSFDYPAPDVPTWTPRVPGLLEMLPEGGDLGTMGGVGLRYSLPAAGGRLGVEYSQPTYDPKPADRNRMLMFNYRREF